MTNNKYTVSPSDRDVNPMPGMCYFTDEVTQILRAEAGKISSVVELGCGRGGNISSISEAQRRVGIDPLLDNVKVARARQGVDIIHGDHRQLEKFADNEFDVGFTVSVIDHIQNPIEAVRSLLRICRLVVMFEPWLAGVSRQATKEETAFWQTSWFHDYASLLTDAGASWKSRPLPLYKTNLGPYFFVFVASADNTALKR